MKNVAPRRTEQSTIICWHFKRLDNQKAKETHAKTHDVCLCHLSNQEFGSNSVKIKLYNFLGVSHSVSRENPNSNAVRGSSTSSTARNKLSSISVYLLIAILINIVFIQCNFWFKLFEWRRYVIALIDWTVVCVQQSMPLEEQPQPLDQHSAAASLPMPMHLGRLFTMPYFWFHIRHAMQWPLFISINLVQSFIQFIHLNGACIAFGLVAAASGTAAAVNNSKLQQPIQSIKTTTVTAKRTLNTELFIIEHHTDCNKFNGRIVANGGVHFDDARFRCDAANNQRLIIQSTQTEQQL